MQQKPRIFALIVAAGTGSRLGGVTPKQYALLGGRPLLRYSLQALAGYSRVSGVQVVIAPEHAMDYAGAACGQTLLPPVHGGAERQDSVRAGLHVLVPHKPDYVLIHDAARPFLSHAVLDRLLEKAAPDKAAVTALPLHDTVRRHNGKGWEEVPRKGLLRMQTPQLFPFAALYDLHQKAADEAKHTDDAALWLAAGLPLDYALGEEQLRKVTDQTDMHWAEKHATGRTAVASGFDVHKFTEGKNGVRIGGVTIAHSKTLEGHSDADVALHAITDALLGGIGAGDIGMHFPPGDKQWKGADSSVFIAEALRLISEQGGRIQHVDVTILCEQPKISPHREAMRNRIAELLKLSIHRVSVKATTTEGLGFTGRGEGIAAQATVTLSLPEIA